MTEFPQILLLEIIVFWLIISGAMITFYARRKLFSAWAEPVLRRPVMVIESDDWGAGPAGQAEVLMEILDLFRGVTDSDGRTPVMTLGLILATADGEKISIDGLYHRQMISVPAYSPLLCVIKEGVDAGVFSIQLHGMEHYWPPALMMAGKYDGTVSDWLRRAPNASTEDLPGYLQTRWVDTSVLPSISLTQKETNEAVAEEVDSFRSNFGVTPSVVVPPTFVWNDTVEGAWGREGVKVIVTPGRRFEARDKMGMPASPSEQIFNGQNTKNGMLYIVRDVYFEPSLGHSVAHALAEFSQKTQLGSPVLFETHRFNFIGSEESRVHALSALESLLRAVLRKYPDTAFLSTIKLGEILKQKDPEWVYTEFRCKVHVWLDRLRRVPRLRKLLWLTGWILPVWLVWISTYSSGESGR